MRIENNLDDKLRSLNDEQLSFFKRNLKPLMIKLIEYCNSTGVTLEENPDDLLDYESLTIYEKKEKEIVDSWRSLSTSRQKEITETKYGLTNIDFNLKTNTNNLGEEFNYVKVNFKLLVGELKKGFFSSEVVYDWETFNYQPFHSIKSEKGSGESYTDIVSFLNRKKYLKVKEMDFLSGFNQLIYDFVDNIDSMIKEESNTKEKVKSQVIEIINKEFDKNKDGELDILEGDNLLLDLLEKHQSIIIDFDHSLVQSIMKLNKFLNTKKNNLIRVFDLLKSTDNQENLDEILPIIRESIDNYQSILVHSLSMIMSIKKKDMITYYELYETFDELEVFNSNWENEMSIKLSEIDSKLDDVVSSIKEVLNSVKSMESTISNKMDQLTYVTKSSFQDLKTSVSSELKSIRSGVRLNNLLTGIQGYQTYKLRKGR